MNDTTKSLSQFSYWLKPTNRNIVSLSANVLYVINHLQPLNGNFD